MTRSPDDLDGAIAGTLLPGFAGPRLPPWVDDALRAGLGGVCLFVDNVESAAQLTELTEAVHTAAPDAVVAIDEEGGDVTRLHHRTGSPAPAMAQLGRLDDEALTERVAYAIGAELRAAGIDLDLAPVADVNSNPANPVIGVRSFGADPALVGRHVAAYVRGLQAAGTGAVAKHFPGHGDTSVDSHRGLPTVAASRDVLEGRELPPFAAAVAAGTLAVMTSHLVVPALDPAAPATFSRPVLQVLRTRLGFRGALVSDALDMAGASAGSTIAEAAVRALAAGVDLLCLGPGTTPEVLAAVQRAVRHAVAGGRLPADRVFEAAGRVHVLSRTVAGLRAAAGAGGRSSGLPPPRVSAAAFRLTRPVPPLRAPVLLRLASAANLAAGETPWGIGDHSPGLAERLSGATCLIAGDTTELGAGLAAAAGRPLVVQGRDFGRVPFLRQAATIVRQDRPDALLVELGWPAPDPAADIATFGGGAATADALIDLLAGGHALPQWSAEHDERRP